MDFYQFKSNICRICLGNNVFLDWNTTLTQFTDTTYKDCYYKYSQLESYVPDPFPQMLCKNCTKVLHSTHILISKALESHKLLQNELRFDGGIFEKFGTLTNSDDFTPTEFETIIVEMVEEPAIDDNYKDNDDFEKQIILTSNVSTKRDQQKLASKRINSCKKENKVEISFKTPSDNSLELKSSHTKVKVRNECQKTIECKKSNVTMGVENVKKEKSVECKVIEYDDDDETSQEPEISKLESKVKRNYNKEGKKRIICSICSKILSNKYSALNHEKTHMENRERKETCKVCGLKLYDKRGLKGHMLIHKENREKKHKCEFCNKAFYNKGGLNVHRRIHLGQMVPCSLCSKQFFRQIDLERHMNSHSATTINSNTKKRSRYFVRCKYCDKLILSTSFKSHTAAHLKEPLMKCTICDREYFSRSSCVLHVKKIHNKNNDEYNDFISIYKKDRLSHLFLEQKADIQPNID